MTRAEVVNGKWHIVKRHVTTGDIVLVSEKSYASRRIANAAYSRGRLGYLQNTMQFIRVDRGTSL